MLTSLIDKKDYTKNKQLSKRTFNFILGLIMIYSYFIIPSLITLLYVFLMDILDIDSFAFIFVTFVCFLVLFFLR